MITTRTKEQTAFDGVRNAWPSDPFTEILYRQVETGFSMDGVVPPTISPKRVGTSQERAFDVREVRNATGAQGGEFGNFVKVMDGIRVPWKTTPKTA